MLDNQRENQCFHDIGGGRWGEEHSKVLKWADSHPKWMDPNVDGMPEEGGQFLVIIKGINGSAWPEVCYYGKNRKSFTSWDHYNDCECTYKKKDVKFWMKIPDYK